MTTFVSKHVYTLRPWPKDLAPSFEEKNINSTVSAREDHGLTTTDNDELDLDYRGLLVQVDDLGL